MILRPPASRNSWKIKDMPAEIATLDLDGVISAEHFDLVKLGYIPRSPADKWFIYFEADQLHFHRATSGSCIFRLDIEPQDDHYLAPRVHVNRDPKQYRSVDDNYDVEIVAYLIDRYLLGRNPPFPQPSRLGKQHRATHQRHVVGEQPKNGSNGFISLDTL